ncbi:translation initiation factor IF-1 [Candidatus Dojkabacteria bacterium]|jgi:translation initiation factor IF-1|nr:translation initiation factor IF-1 [Candidatus Dojkabacteria bacterium]
MKAEKHDSDKTIEVEGTVLAALPKLEYTVEIDFKGIKHILTCHVSGKMKTRFIDLEVGDKVLVRISLYDIDRGIIFRRLTSRQKAIVPAQSTK